MRRFGLFVLLIPFVLIAGCAPAPVDPGATTGGTDTTSGVPSDGATTVHNPPTPTVAYDMTACITDWYLTGITTPRITLSQAELVTAGYGGSLSVTDANKFVMVLTTPGEPVETTEGTWGPSALNPQVVALYDANNISIGELYCGEEPDTIREVYENENPDRPSTRTWTQIGEHD